ncbi:unnamed protein product, partial [marine sediment metagenome]
EIWVPAGATEITGSEIYDKRVFIADFIEHKGDAAAHHAVHLKTLADHPLTVIPTMDDAHIPAAIARDTEVDTKITTHKNIASAHHAKTTSASELTSGVLPSINRLPALATGKIWQGNANRPVEVDSPSIPSGLITMWHGLITNIPSGWVLCDGGSGTPNLLAKFVEGVATAATNPGATGGAAAVSLTTAQLASHSHGVNYVKSSEPGAKTMASVTERTVID